MNTEKAPKISPADTDALPGASGVFWIAAGDEVLFVRLAQNLQTAAREFIEIKSEILARFPPEEINLFFLEESNPLTLYRKLLRDKRPRFDFLLTAESNLPFLILTTSERFPRLLATRRPENAGARGDAIYGAFAPRTGVRFLLDLLPRLFRLRPCELELDGTFDAPCPEYFLGHCLAPCVSRICDDETYMEAAEMARLLLSGQGEFLLERIDKKIESLAAELEFEKAAEWRDRRQTIGETLRGGKWRLNVAGMNDVLTVEENETIAAVRVTTLRRGKSVADHSFERSKESASAGHGEILAPFIAQYYQRFLPQQIFVPGDFAERKFLEKLLGAEFGKNVKIVAQTPENLPPTVRTAQKFSASFSVKNKPKTSHEQERMLDELRDVFALPAPPRRVECFDVAHLAGEAIVAARVVAVGGALVKEEEMVWEFENLSEIESLAAAVGERFRLLPGKNETPDLLVLDGARGHLNAVEKILQKFNRAGMPVVAVVKPPLRHNRVSHFLSNSTGEKFVFNPRSGALSFLQKMRDEAHALANATHRKRHSLVQIFENRNDAPTAPKVQYLLVPTRFVERYGAADDLAPLRSLNQAGKLILKSRTSRAKKAER